MPFSISNTFQNKPNHEKEYSKFVFNLNQSPSRHNISYLSNEHIKEIQRSRLRHILNRENQYERIEKENNLLSKLLFQTNRRSMIDNKNVNYQQHSNILNAKYSQQRLNECKRIKCENFLLNKRMKNIRGQLITREQCNEDWQRHINLMKKHSHYSENIDRFISNKTLKQKEWKLNNHHEFSGQKKNRIVLFI